MIQFSLVERLLDKDEDEPPPSIEEEAAEQKPHILESYLVDSLNSYLASFFTLDSLDFTEFYRFYPLTPKIEENYQVLTGDLSMEQTEETIGGTATANIGLIDCLDKYLIEQEVEEDPIYMVTEDDDDATKVYKSFLASRIKH